MSVRSKLAAVGVATALATTGAVTMAPKAEASLPWCNGVSNVYFNGTKAYQPTYYGSPHCVLSQGATGIAVKNMQAILKYCLDSNLTVDGVFGPQARDTLKMYQRIYGLTPDGVYGPMTRGRLPQTPIWSISGTYFKMSCSWSTS